MVRRDTLKVSEIYRSIQGESTWAGRPCAFVRLTGCPLRCVWCDTAYAFTGGERLSISEILDRVAAFGVDVVELTGGEPLAQRASFVLVSTLLDRGYQVLVETSGALDVGPLDPRAHKIMDLKCPGSGEVEGNLWSNLEHLTGRDEVKFVIRDRTDYEWAKEVIATHGLGERRSEGTLREILFSPVWGEMELRDLAEWMLEDGVPARLQAQLHKWIWPANERGR